MDGWVVIGSKLDTKELEKDLKSAEKRLRDYEKEAEQLTKSKAKAEIDLRGYEDAKRNIQQMTDEALQLAQTQGEVDLQLRLEATQMEELNAKYATQKKNLDEVNRKIIENKKNQALVNQEIQETNRRLNSAKGLGSIQSILSDIGKQTNKVISSVGRWALAIFGVRSAYNFIRSSISTLSQYNTQMATDIEYIKYALASTLQPVIEKLIQLVFKLLSYVNYLAKAWFGIDLFANASADAMNKTATFAEKVKKSLAGFDEMNVLNENGTTGAMGAGLPSGGLEPPEDAEIPEWLVWLKENGASLIPILTGIATAVTAIYLGASLLTGLKLGITIGLITKAIQELLKFADNPNWDTLANALQWIAGAVTFVGVAFGATPAIVAGAVISIIGSIAKLIGAFEWLEEQTDINLKGFDIGIGSTATFFIIQITNMYSSLKGVVLGIWELFKGLSKGLADIFAYGDILGGFKSMLIGLLNGLIAIYNGIVKGMNKYMDWTCLQAEKIGKKFGLEVPESSYWRLPTIEYIQLATGGIVNMPGRGVPIGGAIAGEAGREGVLPLTNSQTMKELGQEIGKYITINASITNTMNGRVISRELQKINANSDFATNS